MLMGTFLHFSLSGKNVKKNLCNEETTPSIKICLTCERPFSWRKKWAKDWEHVKYCSEKCKRNKVHASH